MLQTYSAADSYPVAGIGANGVAGRHSGTVIGGEAIFAMFHDDAGKIELTEVLAEVEGDTFMDDPRSTGEWHEVACKDHPAVGDRPAYRFTTLLKGHY